MIQILLNLPSQIFANSHCGLLGCVVNTSNFTDLGALIGLGLKMAMGFAGIWAMIQMLIAGYMYMGSSGDPKKAEAAWWRLMYCIVGLVVIAAALLTPPIIEKFTGQKVGVIPTK